MKFEKAPGYTWEVDYEWEGEEPDTMVVFAETEEEARKEACYSLDSGETPYKITDIRRVD